MDDINQQSKLGRISYESDEDDNITLSRAESALLSEIMSEPDEGERTHYSHVERALTLIRHQIANVNNEMVQMTVSILGILTKLDHWLKERFKVWLDQMKQYQVESTARFITTSALILSQLKSVTTTLEEVSSQNKRINELEENKYEIIKQNRQRDKNMRMWINQRFTRMEEKQDLILIQMSRINERLCDIAKERTKYVRTLNGVETEIRTLLAREDIAVLLAQEDDDNSSSYSDHSTNNR